MKQRMMSGVKVLRGPAWRWPQFCVWAGWARLSRPSFQQSEIAKHQQNALEETEAKHRHRHRQMGGTGVSLGGGWGACGLLKEGTKWITSNQKTCRTNYSNLFQ